MDFSAPKVKSIRSSREATRRRRVVFVTVPGGDPFDLIGPLMVLQDTNWQLENSGRSDLGYDIEVVSNEPGTVFRENGMRIEVDKACYDIQGAVDTLVFQAVDLSLIHISEPTRLDLASRMPSSA